jgi:hypothetical protein
LAWVFDLTISSKLKAYCSSPNSFTVAGMMSVVWFYFSLSLFFSLTALNGTWTLGGSGNVNQISEQTIMKTSINSFRIKNIAEDNTPCPKLFSNKIQ